VRCRSGNQAIAIRNYALNDSRAVTRVCMRSCFVFLRVVRCECFVHKQVSFPKMLHILSSCAGRLRVHHSSALVFPPGCCGTFASLLQRSTSHKHTLAPHPKRGPQSWFSKHCYSRSAMVQHPSPGNLLKLPKRGKPQIHTQKTSNAIPPL